MGHVLGHVFTLSRACESCLACQHFLSRLLIGHLPREYNNGKGMLSSFEQAFTGREETRAPLKTPAWEANRCPPFLDNFLKQPQQQLIQRKRLCRRKNTFLNLNSTCIYCYVINFPNKNCFTNYRFSSKRD